MLKGSEKRMIVVRTHDSRLFEEAYFVMRPDMPGEERENSDMLREANRIIESGFRPAGPMPPLSPLPSERAFRNALFHMLWFGTGLLCGGGIVGLVWLML